MVRPFTLADVAVEGRRVLLRTDYNVDLEDGRVVDDLRLRATVPTLRALCERGARTVIVTHRGRPKGTRIDSLSTAPLAPHLASLLGVPVATAPDCVGESAEAAVAALEPRGLLLLENVRFHPGEEANDEAFARALARLADVGVGDGFGVVHRAHASVVGVAPFVEAAAMGLLVERELTRLEHIASAPEHPFGVVLGGAKVHDKLPLIEHLLPLADVVCLGGAPANAVLTASGLDVGASRIDGDRADEALAAAWRILAAADRRDGLRLMLPLDVVVAPAPAETRAARVVDVAHVPAGWSIVDIGPRTASSFRAALAGARTTFWNGPMGVVERPPFDAGTLAVASALADVGGESVVGGGETAGAVRRAGLDDRFWHVSTGGGAALALVSGQPLPGI
ncbi:MAG: phosphoglycerate kinase, partial [Chloroflexi bacterium]|nr:phosphoglycerate kinase [Chloroflexota bacterium]